MAVCWIYSWLMYLSDNESPIRMRQVANALLRSVAKLCFVAIAKRKHLYCSRRESIRFLNRIPPL